MAHAIDLSTGTAAVFVVGKPPWHGLGRVIESAATSAQAITLAGLDWRVEGWPLEAATRDHRVPAPGHIANVRTDTHAVLGIVGPDYHIFQNKQAFDFMDSLVQDKLAMFESAGALKGGRKVWMLARIPKEYRAGSQDLIKPYVLLVNTHDGSSSLRMIPTTVRVVCQNTLNLALSGAGHEGIAIRHHASLEQRVVEARAKLGVIAARFDAFDEELHAMLETQLTDKAVAMYFDGLIPPAATDQAQRHRREVLNHLQMNLANERNNLPGLSGTVWSAYNAVSEWADHQRKFRARHPTAVRKAGSIPCGLVLLMR